MSMSVFSSLLAAVAVALAAYVYSTTFSFEANHSDAPDSELPVFFFHGVTGNATNGRNIKANLTAESRVFVGLTFCENECSVQSVTAQIPMAIAQIRSIVQNDSRFDNGYHFVGHSQGGGLARAVVENMDDHKVHSLVSLAGVQNGMFYGPQAEDLVPLHVMINVLGPNLLTKDIFDFSSYAKADWRGKVQRDLSVLGADQTLQTKYSLMNMARPPVRDYFVQNNQYLPYLNNLNRCEWYDVLCHYTKLRHKHNFLRLKSAHFFASPNDGVVAPWQHSLLGRYSEVDSLEEIETKFEELHVVGMDDTVEYTEDTYGLRTLDERGALHRTTVPGVSHNCWLADGPRFDAPGEHCEWQPLWEQYVYSALQ
jgi:palmitoyl-protein thioesterase